MCEHEKTKMVPGTGGGDRLSFLLPDPVPVSGAVHNAPRWRRPDVTRTLGRLRTMAKTLNDMADAADQSNAKRIEAMKATAGVKIEGARDAVG